MRLSNNVKRVALESKLADLRPRLELSMAEAGYDPATYVDVQDLIDILPDYINYFEGDAVPRFYAGCRVYASVDKSLHTDHWMYPLCSATDTHITLPPDELYGRTEYHDTVMDHTANDFLAAITKFATIFDQSGVAQIIVTHVDSEKGAGMLQKLHLIHPFIVGCTLHELFKIMLEWQWAYVYTESREPAAVLCNKILTHFGLNVQNADSNEVVRDLLALPDMQVAQFLKTGEVWLHDSEPEMPLSFKLWANDNMLAESPRPRLAKLYRDCVSYKSIELELARL